MPRLCSPVKYNQLAVRVNISKRNMCIEGPKYKWITYLNSQVAEHISAFRNHLGNTNLLHLRVLLGTAMGEEQRQLGQQLADRSLERLNVVGVNNVTGIGDPSSAL